MAEAAIPVDLFNPGQVFACLGFVEAAEVLLGDVEGGFDWSDADETCFRLRARGEESPVARVLRFLEEAEVIALAPAGSKNIERWNHAWGMQPEVLDPRSGYPFPDPSSPATLACALSDGDCRLIIDHWGDTIRDNVKFWAGAGGYPGAALARDAIGLVRGRATAGADDPFAIAAPQSSSFRFDWRRDYIPIDAGFSLNAHGYIETVGYPLVELLAAIGLTHARPARPDRRNKLEYVYGVTGRAQRGEDVWLSPALLRVAIGGVQLPFPMRRFRMLLDWPGQEGQARSITTVTEERSE